MITFITCYEELAGICVWTAIGHAQESSLRMFNGKIFIRKGATTVRAEAACAICIQVVATLDHKVFDYSMKYTAFVPLRCPTKAILTCAEPSEVLSCCRDYMAKKFEN